MTRAEGPGHSDGVADPAPRSARAVRIGLTGPIGCGKSTVAGWLAERGAVVVDADDVARAVTAPGMPAHDAVIARFGPAIRAADGTLDRAALARLVFASQAALADLEGIVHPAVRPVILAAMEAADASGAPAVIVEAIKLVESGLAALCDAVWLVDCSPATQRSRLLGRGAAPEDADRRIAAQADIRGRVRTVATRSVRSDGPAEALRAAVVTLFDGALANARKDERARRGSAPGPAEAGGG